MTPSKTHPKIGILLTNLGTPDAPTTAAVRRYLAEFLTDPRVITAPPWLWWFILHGFILRVRPQRSARLYQKIWGQEGSPLLSITHAQGCALQRALPDNLQVAIAMRYGNPSITSALTQFQQQQIQRILLLPLYPQYSAATTASTFDAVAKVLKKWQQLPELRMLNHYSHDEHYINALAASITEHRQQYPDDYLLFSFHGLPQDFSDKGDPYEQQCHATAQLVAAQLNLTNKQWSVAFQSRLGPKKWLQPYTDKTLEQLPQKGHKNIAVICPGFAADCLETLEEIALTNKKLFLANGGERFHYIPALNASDPHIKALSQLVLRNIQGWI